MVCSRYPIHHTYDAHYIGGGVMVVRQGRAGSVSRPRLGTMVDDSRTLAVPANSFPSLIQSERDIKRNVISQEPNQSSSILSKTVA